MLLVKVSDILDRAAFFLNDVNRAYFTNDVLIEPFKVAYDDLLQKLIENDVSVLAKSSAVFEIEAGMLDIGGDTGPALPPNLIGIYNLWENPTGEENNYVLMSKRLFLPHNYVQTEYLRWWTFNNQVIEFVGATGTVNVKMNYINNNLKVVEDESAAVNINNAGSFLAYRTAALASKYLGEEDTRSAELNFEAQSSAMNLINVDVKSKQSIQFRRRPYRASYKNSGY